MFRPICALSFALFAPMQAPAHDYKAGDLHIVHPWSRATPGGSKIAGSYLVIKNQGGSADRLVGATTRAAGRVEIHEMAMTGSVMTMRALPRGLDLPAGQEVKLEPGGFHIMFMELKAPLKEGDKVPVTLEFQRAGKVEVTFNVEAIGAKGGHGGGRGAGHGGGHGH